MMRLKSKHIKIGWAEVLIIMIFILSIIWGIAKKTELDSNAGYTKGVITGTHKGSRGSVYLELEFFVGNNRILSTSPKFKGWHLGDTIIIKFNRNKPYDNYIIKSLPKNKTLE